MSSATCSRRWMVVSILAVLPRARTAIDPTGRACTSGSHQELKGDAWIVGRVTMAEMSKAGPHAPANAGTVDRPHHIAARDVGSYAVALDPSGSLYFSRPDIGGDHVVVLLGHGVPDNHLVSPRLTVSPTSWLTRQSWTSVRCLTRSVVSSAFAACFWKGRNDQRLFLRCWPRSTNSAFACTGPRRSSRNAKLRRIW